MMSMGLVLVLMARVGQHWLGQTLEDERRGDGRVMMMVVVTFRGRWGQLGLGLIVCG